MKRKSSRKASPRKAARKPHKAIRKVARRKPGPRKGRVGAGLFATALGKAKRGKVKRKSNRKPMSAAARKAFRERMEAARAARKGGRRHGRAPTNPQGRFPVNPFQRNPETDDYRRHAAPALSTRAGSEPTNRGRPGRGGFGRPANRKTTSRRVGSPDVARLIVETLRGAGYDARALRYPDRIEIETDAPEAVCIEAARAAGA